MIDRAVPSVAMMPTVLLVDDNQPVREGTAALLRQRGFVVTEAASSHEALALLSAGHNANVVLTDYAMPDLSGMELARQMRAHDLNQPVIFVTGYGEPEMLRGQRWVMRKPFDADALSRMLCDAWESARA